MPRPQAAPDAHGGTPWEVLRAFLALGLTSFGGPIAHLGYFRAAFVERRRWLSDADYAELVALCQFLPGPTSSQVGFALGLRRAGWLGGLCAWIGFTLPSALLLITLAIGLTRHGQGLHAGVLQGLKVAAVAVVAQAVWQMARTLCPDWTRRLIALAALLIALTLPGTPGQLGAIALSAIAGAWLLRGIIRTDMAHAPATASGTVSPRVGLSVLVLFILLLLGLPLLAASRGAGPWPLLADVYRAGALVFGGGHVVLPLLETATVAPGWVSASQFLAGYGAAQAVPGPLFTFAGYLGAVMQGPLSGLGGGLLLMSTLFLPGFLLLVAVLPFWTQLRTQPRVRVALAGVNAGVTGLLAAALYQPVWTSAIHGFADLALALLAFGVLMTGRVSPLIVVVLLAVVGGLLPD